MKRVFCEALPGAALGICIAAASMSCVAEDQGEARSRTRPPGELPGMNDAVVAADDRTDVAMPADAQAVGGTDPAGPRKSARTAWRDGVYRARARGYMDDILVEVTVANGYVTGVEVIEHRENRPLRALRDLPRQIVLAQGPDGLDAVTGATATSEALFQAVRLALEEAGQEP